MSFKKHNWQKEVLSPAYDHFLTYVTSEKLGPVEYLIGRHAEMLTTRVQDQHVCILNKTGEYM